MTPRHQQDPARQLEQANRDLRKALWQCREQLARLRDLLDRHSRQDNQPPQPRTGDWHPPARDRRG